MKYLLAAYSLGIAFICIWVPFSLRLETGNAFIGYGLMFSVPWRADLDWTAPINVDWSRMSLRFIAWTAICFAVYAIKFIGKQSAKPEVSKMKAIASLLLVVALSISALAKDARAPLPDKLLTAKTVFIDNEGGYQEPADKCYALLIKWGRYTVVTDPEKADLVFLITAPPGQGAFTGLSVIDPAKKITLWSNTMWAPRGTKMGSLMNELRDRVEAQAKQSHAEAQQQTAAPAQSSAQNSSAQ